MAGVKSKDVQVCFHCVCGNNDVYHEDLLIKWKEFKVAGIKRKIDPATKKPFLVMVIDQKECTCSDEF